MNRMQLLRSLHLKENNKILFHLLPSHPLFSVHVCVKRQHSVWAELHVASLFSDCPLVKAGCGKFVCLCLCA